MKVYVPPPFLPAIWKEIIHLGRILSIRDIKVFSDNFIGSKVNLKEKMLHTVVQKNMEIIWFSLQDKLRWFLEWKCFVCTALVKVMFFCKKNWNFTFFPYLRKNELYHFLEGTKNELKNILMAPFYSVISFLCYKITRENLKLIFFRFIFPTTIHNLCEIDIATNYEITPTLRGVEKNHKKMRYSYPGDFKLMPLLLPKMKMKSVTLSNGVSAFFCVKKSVIYCWGKHFPRHRLTLS